MITGILGGYRESLNMAIKKISEFVSAVPSSDSKILFEQNEKGKSCTIGDAVNTCTLSYEEIIASTNLTGKVASAQSIKDISGRILTGRNYFPKTSSTGDQTVRVDFGLTLPNAPQAIFVTWVDSIAVIDRCDGLAVVPNSISSTGFSVATRRIKTDENWYFFWIVIY